VDFVGNNQPALSCQLAPLKGRPTYSLPHPDADVDPQIEDVGHRAIGVADDLEVIDLTFADECLLVLGQELAAVAIGKLLAEFAILDDQADLPA